MLVLPPEARLPVEDGMHVGVNNHPTRGWKQAADFVTHLMSNPPAGVASATEWTMVNKSLREQAGCS